MPSRPSPVTSRLYTRISHILESARSGVARTVNTTQVVANWLIGREIVEAEQQGVKRAGYGKAVLSGLAQRLHKNFGPGYSVDNLEWFRAFYLGYPALLAAEKSDALSRISPPRPISAAVRRKSRPGIVDSATDVESQKRHGLPTEADLQAELRRELRQLRPILPGA